MSPTRFPTMLPPALSSELISRRLSLHRSPSAVGHTLEEPSEDPERAAVLLPLFRSEGHWRLLFIRRAENQEDRHSGEVAFPGGRLQAADLHSADTALREAREEIGLDPASVAILGSLPSFVTSSNFLVTPIVGRIPWPIPLAPDPNEVARIFSIPLSWLAEPAHHRVQPWRPPGRSRSVPVVFFDDYQGERLWGVSARITLEFLAALTD